MFSKLVLMKGICNTLLILFFYFERRTKRRICCLPRYFYKIPIPDSFEDGLCDLFGFFFFFFEVYWHLILFPVLLHLHLSTHWITAMRSLYCHLLMKTCVTLKSACFAFFFFYCFFCHLFDIFKASHQICYRWKHSWGLGCLPPLNKSAFFVSTGLCICSILKYLGLRWDCCGTLYSPLSCVVLKVKAADHYRECSDKMRRDRETDWWSRAGVNPKCRHQLPDTFQKLSRRRLQNHPGEFDCWITFTFHWPFNLHPEPTPQTIEWCKDDMFL